MMLAEQTGADPAVVEAFAFVHDAERMNDYSDPDHGPRAAILAQEINDEFFRLDAIQLNLLMRACEGHSTGETEAELTVQICWDADRLDLGRAGIKPCPTKLCTDAARQSTMIEWAYLRSIQLE
ncbi:MAG: hypothetical protein K6L73_06375 [Cellvibrionaceae bacterium]